MSLAELELEELQTMTLAELSSIVGGLSNPSKMPGYAYSLPAQECRTGGELQKREGSVCYDCYALKGRYAFRNVRAALYRRLESLSHPLWIPAMVELISRRAAQGHHHFRWHDSGDLQSLEHLEQICEVARRTPQVRHWIPTREYRTVADYIKSGGEIPENLNVRMSAHMVGGAIPTFPRLPVTVSTVFPHGETPEGAHQCPAPQQENSCGSCRACWDSNVRLVNYTLH